MPLARIDDSTTDGHARRERHDLTPINAWIVDAGSRRPKLGVGFDTKGDLSNAQALVNLTSSCEIDGFRDRHQEQFLSLGIAKQNMMSFAVGLAGCGPFVHSFGVCMCLCTHDRLKASIACPRHKVRLMGFLPGVTTPGGMTHQSIEDISFTRPIPKMTILECGDATAVESTCEAADSIDGPVWCRILRGSVPRLLQNGQGNLYETSSTARQLIGTSCRNELQEGLAIRVQPP